MHLLFVLTSLLSGKHTVLESEALKAKVTVRYVNYKRKIPMLALGLHMKYTPCLKKLQICFC